MSKTATPKGTLTLASVGPGFSTKDVALAGTTTVKFKRDKVLASLAISDGTLKAPKTLKDVIATLDYSASKSTVVNTKYELGSKKYTVGATWNGQLAKKASTVKLFYTNKDSLVSGEATVAVNKNLKANTTFNQKQLLTAKLSHTKGDYLLEPSYNFAKSAPAIAVTKKMQGKDTLKVSYDFKSEAAAAEYAHLPFKVALATKVAKGNLSVTKPTLSAVYENTFSF